MHEVLCLLRLTNHRLSAASNTEGLSLFVKLRLSVADVCAGDAAMNHGKCVIKLGFSTDSSEECCVDAANAVVPNVAMRDSGKLYHPR